MQTPFQKKSAALQSQIDANTANDAQNAANDAAESARAKAAEGVGATALTAEATARSAADTAETSARQSADNTESAARTQADATLATNLANDVAADAAEVVRAKAAETANASAISTETTRAQSIEALKASNSDKRINVQRQRLACAADGSLTWVFSPAFAQGVVPIVTCDVEAPSGATVRYSAFLTAPPTNTTVTFKIVKDSPTTVVSLGLTLLGLPAPSGIVYVHLTAGEPV